MAKYESCTLVQLKEELRKRKAKVSGRKKELIERLIFYDANFAVPEADNPEYKMTTPDPTQYKDLNGSLLNDFPPVTVEMLLSYLKLFGKGLDEKCKQLYYERFIRYVRVAKVDDFWYITAMVWAEMRKSTSYKVDISVDENGIVHEAQCECGAGQGPSAHCKHVSTILYGITCFRNGGELLTELTCTQQLQTFHRVKAYTGSPMKSSDLPMIRKRESPVFDPRPAKFRKREEYNDEFRNTCINFQTQRRMPVKQLFIPANPHALMLDHSYSKVQPLDDFLKREKITHITSEEVKVIESETRGQSSNKKWEEKRNKRITSCNFGTICKATERRDKVALAASLTMSKELHAKAIVHGKKYEAVALRKYEKKYGVTTSDCGMFISTENPFLSASPDGILEDRLIEVKCPYAPRNQMISPSTVPYLKQEGDHILLKENSNYYYQVQGQLYCTGYDKCDFVVHTFKDQKDVTILRNDKFITDMIMKLKAFYDEYFYEAVLNRFLYRNYYNFSFK